MNKEERIKRYGKDAYAKHLAQMGIWRVKNPEKVKTNILRANHEQNRKGGRHYEKRLKDAHKGLRHARDTVRHRDGRGYRPYKQIVAPDSQLHHNWAGSDSAEYTGLALVEADAHMHGFIDVIEILDGKITLFTEAEVRKQ